MNSLSVIILAAGKGTRMNDLNIPKVCRKVGELTMIEHVVNTALKLKPDKIIMIVSQENYPIISQIINNNRIIYVIQRQLLGTASAVLSSEEMYSGSNILVLLGDVPLLKVETLQKVIGMDSKATILGFQDSDINNRFGRIILNNHNVDRIVEYAEATDEEKKIDHVNAGILYLNANYTFLLNHITNNNSKGEYYLTDIVKIMNDLNHKVSYYETSKEECLGANTPLELQNLNNIYLRSCQR